MLRLTALLCLVVCLCIATSATAQSRSSWIWKKSSHPYGSVNILGNAAKEAQAIASMGAWGFDRIYTSTNTISISDRANAANWNASLDAAGIDVQYLMGENGAAVEPVRSAFLTKVQDRLIDFNNSRVDPAERFDALHLDIEPHTTVAWDTGTPADRRDILLGLETTYSAIRALLDGDGQAAVKMYADIPVWYDTSSSIGWTDTAERDQWYTDIAVPLDGLTMMAYERDTLSHIVSGITYEANNFAGEVRVGINAKEVGPGDTFEDFDEYTAMVAALEGLSLLEDGITIGGVDHHPFYTFVDLSGLPGDYDHDGNVNTADYTEWVATYADAVTPGADADGNGDGSINAADYTYWRDVLVSPSWSLAIPEPSTFAMSLLAIGLNYYRRR